MNFQSDIINLENEFDVFKQKSSQTNESWNDSVQERFYNQFIENLPKEFQHYIEELKKLDKIFETAEGIIDRL